MSGICDIFSSVISTTVFFFSDPKRVLSECESIDFILRCGFFVGGGREWSTVGGEGKTDGFPLCDGGF